MRTTQIIGITAIVTATIAIIILFLIIPPGDGLWAKYNGHSGENGALDVGDKLGNYLDAIKTRADADGMLDGTFKNNIKNRCDALKQKPFQDYTKDETYLIILVAERHSALNHWTEVWERLNGTLHPDATWTAEYQPTAAKISDYDQNVKSLLYVIKGKYPGNSTIVGLSDERLEIPHKTANRNTSWARILLGYEYALNGKPNLVGEELDHPEARTK